MHSRFRRSLLIVVGVFSAVALAPRRAHAYAWMIGHGYAGCATCHLDPSGAGLLNEFGREEAADTLRSHYGSDPAPVEPFFGLWKNPDWLLTGGSFRDGLFFMKAGTRAVLPAKYPDAGRPAGGHRRGPLASRRESRGPGRTETFRRRW